MVKNRKFSIVVLLFSISSVLQKNDLYAGAGKSFGLFAGGAVAGSLLTSAIKDNRRRRYEEPVVERPVYVQQPVQQTVQAPAQIQTHETQQLQNQVSEQDQRIRDLERELKQQRKRNDVSRTAAKRRKKNLNKEVFDDFDSALEN